MITTSQIPQQNVEAPNIKRQSVDPAARAARLARYKQQQVRLVRASRADTIGAAAFERLLTLAETRDSGQIEKVASFIRAVWFGAPRFDVFDLRLVDVEIADDMLAVLDCTRWGPRVEDLVPNGNERIADMLSVWESRGLEPFAT